MSVVVDASAFIELLLRTARGPAVAAAVGHEAIVAPDLIGPEVVSTLRGLERGGKLTSTRAETALRRFERAPVQTVKTANLLARAWELRHNLSAYDACYERSPRRSVPASSQLTNRSRKRQRRPYPSRSYRRRTARV
jgi:predicted nucleic acid-binding protein